MEAKISDAYAVYIDATGKAGMTPVDSNTFRAWVLAGGNGDIPLGAPYAPAQATTEEEQAAQLKTAQAAAPQSSLTPLLLLGASMLTNR